MISKYWFELKLKFKRWEWHQEIRSGSFFLVLQPAPPEWRQTASYSHLNFAVWLLLPPWHGGSLDRWKPIDFLFSCLTSRTMREKLYQEKQNWRWKRKWGHLILIVIRLRICSTVYVCPPGWFHLGSPLRTECFLHFHHIKEWNYVKKKSVTLKCRPHAVPLSHT